MLIRHVPYKPGLLQPVCQPGGFLYCRITTLRYWIRHDKCTDVTWHSEAEKDGYALPGIGSSQAQGVWGTGNQSSFYAATSEPVSNHENFNFNFKFSW